MSINIVVRNKTATAPSGTAIVCGNNDYLLTVDFDAEWDAETIKFARFVVDDDLYVDVSFAGNEVLAPSIATGETLKIGFFAGDIRTTTPASVRLLPSITSISGGLMPSDHDAFVEMLQLVTNALNEFVEVQNSEFLRIQAEQERVLAEAARSVYEAYDPEKQYAIGNKVVLQGSSYICVNASLGNAPPNETYWLLIAAAIKTIYYYNSEWGN